VEVTVAGLIKEIGQEEFKTIVELGKGLFLVDFWAPWCGPCRMIAPVLEKLAEEYANRLTILKVNVDENEALARQFGISAIPTMVFFKDGKKIDQVIGAPPAQKIKDAINQKL
jgi:thioredoxin 1